MSLKVTKSDLMERIGRKLGYGDTSSAWNTQEENDIERVLEDSLRRFYDPQILPGEREKHQWGFLFPIKNLTFTADQYAYEMPQDFSMLNGPITYAPGQEAFYPSIEVTTTEKVMYRLQQGTFTGRPTLTALRLRSSDQVAPTVYEALFWPIPDDAYEIAIPYRSNPNAIGYDGGLPLGGQAHYQCLIDACMLECARFDELPDMPVYQQTFIDSLRSCVSHDRRTSNPDRLGYCGDDSDMYGGLNERQLRGWWNQSSLTTVNGVVPS